MSEEKKRGFWSWLFGGPGVSPRRQKVLEYLVHRMNDGVDLNDALEEEYVVRNLSRSEREEISSNPRLVEAARERMQKDLGSGPQT